MFTFSYKFIAVTVLIAINFVTPAIAADGIEEVLFGVKLTANDIELSVASGGCTRKEDFSIVVNKGITGKSPYFLTVRRNNPDECKKFVPEGVLITFSKEELGLNGAFEMTLTNKIGNTSQHR